MNKNKTNAHLVWMKNVVRSTYEHVVGSLSLTQDLSDIIVS
jgi:hypothetical protein